MVTLLNTAAGCLFLKAKAQHIGLCTHWRPSRHLTLRTGHRITKVTLSAQVNLSCPWAKQLFYINITWEAMEGIPPPRPSSPPRPLSISSHVILTFMVIGVYKILNKIFTIK